jgi:ectoine hydroxylase-related dioxygenase (phytanoyl-CoA dioxygenase family)
MTTGLPVRRGVFDAAAVRDLSAWADAVKAWPVGSHRFGQYVEGTADGDRVCRTENVSACHDGFRRLVIGPLAALAEDEWGEPVVDFKDKLNYKHPGGAGFSAHQDLPAYPGARRVLSLLVAIDDCSTDSGCLWMAPDVRHELDTDERGVVRPEVAASLGWEPVELAPGDALGIDGLAPHYSEANRSDRSRRVFIVSYAPAADGYGREHYYRARADAMRVAGGGGPIRISTLGDFEGAPPTSSPAPAAATCTHP